VTAVAARPGPPARAGAALDDLGVPRGRSLVVTTDDGARLAVTDVGDRITLGGPPPVVLAHCWTGSRAVWAPVARRLVAAGHRVVLYDQRGHGASTTGSTPVAVERLGDDLARVVEALDLRDAVVAGHSMGGMSVMACACRHPELVRHRVRRMVLVATAAHGLAAGGRDRFWRMVLWRGWLNRLMVRPRLGRALVRPTFGRRARRSHVEATRALFVATDPVVRRHCALAMGEMDLREALAGVDTPATVLLGRRDQLVVNTLTRAIVHHVATARLVELPDAGHMLPLERPDDVAAAISR
jgi:pimeloyl-ACP methyl ester carboxylesterase